MHRAFSRYYLRVSEQVQPRLWARWDAEVEELVYSTPVLGGPTPASHPPPRNPNIPGWKESTPPSQLCPIVCPIQVHGAGWHSLVGSSPLFPSLLRHWTSSCYGPLAVTPIEPLPEGTDLNNLRNSGTWSLQGGMLSLANAWRKNRSSPDKGDKGIPQRGKEMWKVLKAKRSL